MESFKHAIGTRVISCGINAVDSKKAGKGGKQGGFKLHAAICCDGRGNTKDRDPAGYENMGNCVSCDVWDWDCFRPSSISINTSEKIAITV